MHKAPEGLEPEAVAFWEEMVASFRFEPHELQILTEATRLLNEAHVCEQLATDEERLVQTRVGCRPHPLLKHIRDTNWPSQS